MSSEESQAGTRGYSPSRRRFLELISYLLGAIAAGFVAIPIVGAYLSPLLAVPPGQWRRVGRVSDFPVGNFVEATFLNASPAPWSQRPLRGPDHLLPAPGLPGPLGTGLPAVLLPLPWRGVLRHRQGRRGPAGARLAAL